MATDKFASGSIITHVSNSLPIYVSASANSVTPVSVAVENIEHKKNADFKDLSYSDVQINLRLLSNLNEGDQLMILDGTYIQVDDRYFFSGLRRAYSSDSRKRSLDFIEHVITWAQKHCLDAVDKIKRGEEEQNNKNKLKNIQFLLTTALSGMDRFANTYKEDRLTESYIDTLRKNMLDFLAQELIQKALL